MQTNFLAAINLIAEEKNLPRDIIIETVEAALAAAYKKDYTDKDQEARAVLDQETGDVRIFESKAVVPDGEVDQRFSPDRPLRRQKDRQKSSGRHRRRALHGRNGGPPRGLRPRSRPNRQAGHHPAPARSRA
jgi:N utilization substance protein A